MRRTLLFVVTLFTIVTLNGLGLVWLSSRMSRATAGPVATENGDCNGDSVRDISDIVYLAQWLFDGGPEPVAIAQGPVAPSSWPPAPEMIVNLDSANEPDVTSSEGLVPVPTTGFRTIFEVPDDSWFVVTDMKIYHTVDPVPFPPPARVVTLIEVLGGTETVRRNDSFLSDYSSATGVTFAPGSSVALRAESTGSVSATYTITGYLVPRP